MNWLLCSLDHGFIAGWIECSPAFELADRMSQIDFESLQKGGTVVAKPECQACIQCCHWGNCDSFLNLDNWLLSYSQLLPWRSCNASVMSGSTMYSRQSFSSADCLHLSRKNSDLWRMVLRNEWTRHCGLRPLESIAEAFGVHCRVAEPFCELAELDLFRGSSYSTAMFALKTCKPLTSYCSTVEMLLRTLKRSMLFPSLEGVWHWLQPCPLFRLFSWVYLYINLALNRETMATFQTNGIPKWILKHPWAEEGQRCQWAKFEACGRSFNHPLWFSMAQPDGVPGRSKAGCKSGSKGEGGNKTCEGSCATKWSQT